MRKHDVRKWLHAILDLLPVILIPVFMIYSHRHEINDGSIQVQEKRVIDFNQLLSIDEPWVVNDLIFTRENNGFKVQPGANSIDTRGDNSAIRFYIDFPNFDKNHLYQVNFSYSSSNSSSVPLFELFRGVYTITYDPNLVTNFYSSQFRLNSTIVESRNLALFKTNLEMTIDDYFYISNIGIFDLTQMYGEGNEPTIQEFNSTFTDSYYPYTLSHKYLINGDLVTYNDTDIMSQFTYQLYNSVDKYFNMGNVFHLNEVYDWFNLNIFNGQAPIYIFIVYQIVLYELIMDLLMLLYALFMWFIDMIEKLMEKPLNSVK